MFELYYWDKSIRPCDNTPLEKVDKWIDDWVNFRMCFVVIDTKERLFLNLIDDKLQIVHKKKE